MVEAELREAKVVRQGRDLIRDVNLNLTEGSMTVLVGPNGAGKSTLLRSLLGLTALDSGSATINGTPVRELGHRDRAGQIGWLPQVDEVREPINALQYVMGGRFRFGESRHDSEVAARKHLDAQGAGELADRRWHSLSGGERQRVALAGLLAQETPLVLFDEPARHLDPRHQMDLYSRIGQLASAGHGVLCVTHDIDQIHFISGEDSDVRIIGLREGSIRFECGREDATLPEKLGSLFDVRYEVVETDSRRALIPVRDHGPTR